MMPDDNSIPKLNNDINFLQSKTIDFLRFPLAVMVVFIHMNPDVINLEDAGFSPWSWHGIYNICGILLSKTLSRIAVPTFFFISGFLFFINFQGWNWSQYRLKIKKRIKTLFLPYMMWNGVSFVLMTLPLLIAVCCKGTQINVLWSYLQKYSWHIFYDCNDWGVTRTNWLGDAFRMTGPYDLPLWFLRDLIVVTISAPLIFWILKRLKMSAVILLFIAYISRIWITIPGFNVEAWFFFSLGSYFALSEINIVKYAQRYALVFILLSIILLPFTIVYDGASTIIGQNILPIFICSGVFSAVYIASKCVSTLNMAPNKFLISSCFFIYAFHLVPLPYIGSPLNFVTKILGTAMQSMSGEATLSYGNQLLIYIISPILTILIGLLIFKLARRFFPRGTLIFSGNK